MMWGQRWLASLMRTLAVARWESRLFFQRPATYGLLLAIIGVAGWSFSWLLTLLARGGGLMLRFGDDPVVQFLGPNVFLIGVATLLTPLLTMSLIAEERRRGTWELLLGSAASRGEILIGKWLAAWLQWSTILAPWWVYALVLRVWDGRVRWLWDWLPWPIAGINADLGATLAAAWGWLLVGAVCMAIGTCVSACSKSAAAAATLTLGAMCMLLLASLLPQALPLWHMSEAVPWLQPFAIWSHLEQFSQGRLPWRLACGLLAATLGLLWLATVFSPLADHAVVRHDAHAASRLLRNSPLLLLGCLALGGSTRFAPLPFDLTTQRVHTLAPQTVNVLKSLKDPVEVIFVSRSEPRTTGERAFQGAAQLLQEFLTLSRQQQPKLHVLNWDATDSAEARQLQQQYPDVVPPCVVIRPSAVSVSPDASSRKPHVVLTARDIIASRSSSEPNRPATIEFFGEQAVAAALLRLNSPRSHSVVYFLQGHGELSLQDDQEGSHRGIGLVAARLADSDFEPRPLVLGGRPVPLDADVVVIAGPEAPLAKEEIQELREYLRRKGQLVCLLDQVTDARGQPIDCGVEQLLAEFEIQIGRDKIVSRTFAGQLQSSSPAIAARGEHPLLQGLPAAPITFYDARSVRMVRTLKRSGVEHFTLLTSYAAPDAWAETTLDPARSPEYDAGQDLAGPVGMAVAAERRQGLELLPILVVVGDSEFAANSAVSEPGGRAGLVFLLSAVNWLRARPEALGDIAPRRHEPYRLASRPTDLRRLVFVPTLLMVAGAITAGALGWQRQRWG